MLLGYSLLAQSARFSDSDNSITISKSNISNLEMEVNLSEINFSKIKTENRETYYLAQIENFAANHNISEPNIPVYRQLIEIPFGAEVKAEVIILKDTVISLSDFNIDSQLYPVIAPVIKSNNAKPVVEINERIYNSDKFYSIDLIEIEKMGIMRAANIARVNYSPISYNPVKNQLKIITKAKIKIEFSEFNIAETLENKQLYQAPSNSVVNKNLINSGAFGSNVKSQSQYPLTYVIVADTMFRAELQDFVKWKNQQGYRVIEAYLQNPAVGSTTNSIKSYLQGLYNNASSSNPAPTHLLLVGDVAQLPAFNSLGYGAHVTDLYYAEYTNDIFPEVLYGRFPASTKQELENMVEKSIYYEEYQMANSSYLSNAILVGGYDNTFGPTHGNGQVNYANNNYFNSSNNITSNTFFHPSSSNNSNQIKALADSGAGFINYTAHGTHLGWQSPSFTVSDVANMTNLNKYPVVVSNACLTNEFDKSVCFGEALLRAEKKGAIAHIGASNNTYWDEDFYWSVGYGNIGPNQTYAGSGLGYYDKLFHTHGEPRNQWSVSTSEMIYAGNLAVTQSSNYVNYYWEVYHVMGDPSLIPYLWEPSPITTSFNNILMGTNSLQVSTAADALVALSQNDTLITASFSDSLGNVNLDFPAFTSSGTAVLTVSGQNIPTSQYNVNIISPNGPYVIYDNHSIIELNGNNNGNVDFGEEISFNLAIHNITSFNANTIEIKLVSNDNNVDIIDSVKVLSSIAANSIINIDSIFKVKFDSSIVDQHMVKFNLEISDLSNNTWNSFFFQKAISPSIKFQNFSVDDSNGNNNGIMDPGEVVNLNIDISNSGSADLIRNMSLSILSSNPNIIISPTSINIDSLEKNNSHNLIFSATIDNSVKEGSVVSFDFDLNAGQYFSLNTTEKIVIGSVLEDFETADFNKFKWDKNNSDWIISSDFKNGGSFSAKSKLIGNFDTTSLQIQINVLQDDSISFYKKVDSEYNYDYLNFYIDGVLMDKWSGNDFWSKETYGVKKGLRIFTWKYIKDYFDENGLDAAWIDDIKFPVTDALSNIENVSQNSLSHFSVYPNPNDGNVNVIFDLKQNQSVNLKVYNQLGMLIKNVEEDSKFIKGEHELNISLSDVKSGIYFIEISSEDFNEIRKIIVL
jgi:hypothetical protein